ncbi:unnamed protein product [Cuscuta epithymum]|uniref:Exocyst subunit Exo70 family protein n=1 Tax=Cuscuta epithymum TaxID=186058 RepID=A0AAV0CYY7_9ASTE|nr:unnamed protein product [Cuscuta epithymum]
MDGEKEMSQQETPPTSVPNKGDIQDNDTPKKEQPQPEEANQQRDDSPPENLPPTDTVHEAKRNGDGNETTATDDLQENQAEKISAVDHHQTGEGDNGEQQGGSTLTSNEEGGGDVESSQQPELPPDLSKVSEEIDQYISDSDNMALDSKVGDDDGSPRKKSLPDVPTYVDQFASLVEAKFEGTSRNGEAAVKLSQLEEEEAEILFESVKRTSRLHKSLLRLHSSSEEKYAESIISRVGGVLHRAVSYFEDEFRSSLENHKIPDPAAGDGNLDAEKEENVEKEGGGGVEEDSENSDRKQQPEMVEESNNFPGYDEKTVSCLNRLATTMIFCGYETECWQVYFISRRNALEESLLKLGFEKHSIDDVQKMNWETVEREIDAWIATFKHFTNVMFSCERKLADAVFHDCQGSSSSMSAESIFTCLSRSFVIQFFVFPEAVAMTKRSAEKLFKFLDLYEAMRDLLPIMYTNFPTDYVNELKAEATLTSGRLGEAMVGIFTELENSIKSDSGKTPVPGGAVHPLTRYTMNYLKLAGDYKETLEQVFRQHQKIDRADSASGLSDFDYNRHSQQQQTSGSQKPPAGAQARQLSPLEMQIAKVMDLLDTNLDSKSKLYKDISLSSIFMMNNGRYILQKVRGSPQINALMGDQWCRKRSSDLRQYHKNYQRETWGRLLQCLTIEGLSVHGKVNKPVLKERFKSFNALFDEIHKTQSSWVISDEQLQSELRVSISNMVIPAYRSFLARFSQTFTPGRQTEKYVKYQAEDIETYIDELFDGNASKK